MVRTVDRAAAEMTQLCWVRRGKICTARGWLRSPGLAFGGVVLVLASDWTCRHRNSGPEGWWSPKRISYFGFVLLLLCFVC
jgi:hypothetical protein